ncbi:Interferon-induced very large GTPase 1 [Holothuria leucospilota]|uniref:Interferon-induced very large GTPase 1 n=1 Tax=Holothuria leucospilota TaxID=206669 RepID=A0A9Q0YK65_HOLLE|nr:Interferon-induced very large GTPase 1 [Holothuria leucospilota]
MENRFGAFKIALSEDLTIEDSRKLCTYFEVSSAKTESILNSRPQGLVLLNELEEQGHITSKDIHKLGGAFKQLKMDRQAKEVEEYEKSHCLSESSTLPEDLESDEDLDETENRPHNISFEEFKTKCGLRETLTLKKMLEVKSPGRTATPAELFWEKITSLDYRITSLEISKDLSVRDLVFAVLRCSDNVLRQDIIAKMTSCQLAVPLVLNGVNNSKPVLLYWAFRTIRKKIQTLNDTDPIERPMYKHEAFTVSFLRIGDIRFSKSDLLNSLLSECQGNQPHSFYISKKGNVAKPSFSNGSIELVWYIPEAGDKAILKSTTAFLNLRGDSQQFQFQTEFLCKISNLTFVLIGKQNWKVHKEFLENIKKMAANVLVLAIREADDETADKYLNLRYESVIVVQKLHMTILNEEICSRINKSKETHPKLWSLENFKDHARRIVEVDISNEYLATIKGIVENIVPKEVDITQFKNNILRLFPFWVEWARLDEITYTTESGKEHQRASREEEKISQRKQQLATNISQKVKAFWDLLNLVGCKSDLFDDCLIYLQTLLFDLTHAQQGCSKSAQKFLYDRLSEKASYVQLEMEDTQLNLNDVYSNETKILWQMSIGIEDFMRELGQLFEASLQCGNDQTNMVNVMRLPALAAQFIANGNSLELLDDKSYSVPICWIRSILEELHTLLGGKAKVFVLSVIGIQGSGKSTLLNTMFGTKFPVSAGRCTRGLFLRLLKVEESFAEGIGCNYQIILL